MGRCMRKGVLERERRQRLCLCNVGPGGVRHSTAGVTRGPAFAVACLVSGWEQLHEMRAPRLLCGIVAPGTDVVRM